MQYNHSRIIVRVSSFVETLLGFPSQAAFAHSAVTVPLYDTLGPETVEFIVNQTGLATVVCGGVMELQKLVEIAAGGRCPTLQVCENNDIILDC